MVPTGTVNLSIIRSKFKPSSCSWKLPPPPQPQRAHFWPMVWVTLQMTYITLHLNKIYWSTALFKYMELEIVNAHKYCMIGQFYYIQIPFIVFFFSVSCHIASALADVSSFHCQNNSFIPLSDLGFAGCTALSQLRLIISQGRGTKYHHCHHCLSPSSPTSGRLYYSTAIKHAESWLA